MFYLNPYSKESIRSQWIKYLQTACYIRDINGIVTRNRIGLENTINNASAKEIKTIEQVMGTLNAGFNEISHYLQSINSSISAISGQISDLSAMLDWKLSEMIEEQAITNRLLGHIVQLSRVSDNQKVRIDYIEQGLKYIKNALIDNSPPESAYYEDAMEYLLKAESLEKRDYIVLGKIGYIYLYSNKLLDFKAAEDYFLRSVREALAESNVGGSNIYKNMSPSGNLHLVYSQNPYLAAAAEAYIYAARSCYLQRALVRAIEYAGMASTLVPQCTLAKFEQAKYYAANNQVNESVKILEPLIKKDRLYANTVLNDYDLLSKPEVQNLIDVLAKDAIWESAQNYHNCINIIKTGSEAKSKLDEIKRHINTNSYIGAMNALDMLQARYNFPFKHAKVNSNYRFKIDTWEETPSLTIFEYIRKENSLTTNEIEDVKRKLRSELILADSIIGWQISLPIASISGLVRGCSVTNVAWDSGTAFSTIFFIMLLGVVIGAIYGYYDIFKKGLEEGEG